MPEQRDVAYDWFREESEDQVEHVIDEIEGLSPEYLDTVNRMRDAYNMSRESISVRTARIARPVQGQSYRPYRGDLVKVVRTEGIFHEGELALIDDVYDRGCGDQTCTSCTSVTVMMLRVTGPEQRQPWSTAYHYMPPRLMEPVAPTAFGQLVRCQHAHQQLSPLRQEREAHRHNGECVSPVRVTSWGDDHEPLIHQVMVPAFELVWATELEVRRV